MIKEFILIARIYSWNYYFSTRFVTKNQNTIEVL